MADITKPLTLEPQMRWTKAVLLAALLLFGFYASTHMVAAGDTWVAMACGRHFANHGVDTVEPFSFNSHTAGPSDEQLESWPEWTHGIIRFWHPTGWINQNWLTHLSFYKLATWFGRGGPELQYAGVLEIRAVYHHHFCGLCAGQGYRGRRFLVDGRSLLGDGDWAVVF